MKILCFGAGAIGTYIGGSLALAGNEVVFLERPDVVPNLKAQGLRLKLEDGEHVIQAVLAAGDIETALNQGPFDAAIFAMKAFDTESALTDLVPFSKALPPLICFQNGVENEAKIARLLGDDKVIPGTVTSAVTRRGIGDIVLERKRGVGIAAGHPIAPALVQTLGAAGLNAQYYPNGAGMKWSKMLTNLIANASSAILDMTPGEVFANPALFHLELRQLRETLNVMRAMRIPVVDLPGTPVRLLAFAVSSLPERLAQPLLQRSVGSGRGAKMPSFHIDLHAGRKKSEVDHLNGAVVRFGERCGVPTPVNRVLNETLLALTQGELEVSSFSRRPERLLTLM